MILDKSIFLKCVSLTLALSGFQAFGYEQATSTKVEPVKSNAEALQPLPKEAKAQHFSIIERDACNEIALLADGADMRWDPTTVGGEAKILQDLPELKTNMISDVTFGKKEKISFSLRGKKVTETVDERTLAGAQFHSLRNENNETIGKFLGLMGSPRPQDTIMITDEAKKSKEPRLKIKVAVFYLNQNPANSKLQVPCQYVKNDFNFQELEKQAQCVWIDSESKSVNGKPYCF